MKKFFLILVILFLFITGCAPDVIPATSTQYPNIKLEVKPTETQTPLVIVPTQTPQATAIPITIGPDDFPNSYNPLTGQPVADPSLLEIPALLVSISHFPPIARPQAGLSFAPFVYEFSITQGSTRYLAVFHGEFPEPEIPLHGECGVRYEPITQTDHVIGNRVWYDENKNGLQDTGEGGIGGVCINLLDAAGNLLGKTTSDSNGYYAFNVETGSYIIEFVKRSALEFTQKNVGNENQDSDADQTSGWTDAFEVTTSLLLVDAGLIPSPNSTQSDKLSINLPPAQVGPVRSGRLLYQDIGTFYQNSCLIYASADPEVLAQIPTCATVPHTAKNGGAMLELERMKRIAEQNRKFQANFNYASNLFSDEPPEGGVPAQDLLVYWAYLNQSQWKYDAASQAWWRYVDESDPALPGIVHPEVDRLNGRQLIFENVIVLFAEHTVYQPTIVDMDLGLAKLGNAFLFRDGLVYKINWSTLGGEYEKTTGLPRPIHFNNRDGSPIPLKPGHTWVVVLSTQSYVEELSANMWRARFIAPAGMD
ncbi:MAG TPA: SdrD B-like domain-containing protein [Anaerolineales bacterium]|nr:SdrD B-like domain-containing protein [Anaerolineales bacterium]